MHILPAVNRQNLGSRFGQELGANFGEGYSKGKEIAKENAALKKRGIDVEGLTGETRSQVIAHDLKYGAKKKAIEATQERGFDSQGKPSSGDLGSRTKKESLPGFMGQEGIEPKKGLYTQKTSQGDLQPIRSAEQVQQSGIELARNAMANGFPMSDQEGIEYENAKNNLAIQSNQRIQREQQVLQQEKNEMKQKGQNVAA